MKLSVRNKRAGALVTACLMLFMMLSLFPAQVKAAGTYSIGSVSVVGSDIEASQPFGLDVSLTSTSDDSGVSVSVNGLGALSGSYDTTVNFSSGAASIRVPVGKLIYSGSGTPMVDVAVGSEHFQRTLSGFVPKDDGGSDEPVTPTVPSGIFMVAEDAEQPFLNAGQSKEIVVPITNTTSRRYTDVQLTVELPNGVYFNTVSNTQKVSFGFRETKDLKLNIAADSGAASGVYPVTVKASGKYSGENFDETFTFNLKINGTGGSTAEGFTLAGYKLDRNTVQAGDAFKLTLTVKNNSGAAVSDIPVQLSGFSTEGITVNGGVDIQSISSIAANGMTSITYNLQSSAKMSSGNHILDVSIGGGGALSNAKVFIPVQSSGESADGVAMSKPQIVMEGYDYGDAGAVTGGVNFVLKMSMRNTSKQVAIENIKMTISSVADSTTGGVFTPANSSNSFFIERVAAGSTFSEEIELTPKADASPKSYGLQIDFSYEAVIDGQRETLTSTETINIPVVQPDRFEIGEIESWGPFYVGQQGYAYIQYVNKGKTAVYNLSVEVEGNFTVSDLTSYIGNVESGSADGMELNIIPNEAGTMSGTIKFTYEDSAGTPKEVVKEFTGEAIEMTYEEPIDPGIDMPTDVPTENTGLPMWAWIAIVGGGLVVAAVITIVVLKKVKARKARKLEEDDDYDDEN